jgi:hypothetical protein
VIKAALALVMATLSTSQIDLIKKVGVVRVQHVQTGDYGMKANEVARAVRTNDGKKYILINLNADLAEMDGWYWHEMAHLAAWEVHGEDIETHGPEFRKICRQLVTHRTDYYCKGS